MYLARDQERTSVITFHVLHLALVFEELILLDLVHLADVRIKLVAL